MSPRFKRLLGAAVVATAAAVAVPTLASAWIELPFEATYTGCLKDGGTIVKVQQGNEPKSNCADNESEIHISGGDITGITAGTGLSGGGLTGETSLQLATSYRLPQACTNTAIPRWTGAAWACGTDTGGVHSSTIGLGDITAAGPTDPCVDGDAFTGFNEQTANTKNLVFVLPAGKYIPETAGNTRWYMNKTADLYDGETFARGFVKMEIVKNQNNVDTVVSTWARAETENMDGGGMPYNQDFSSFTADGSAKFYLRATVHGGACTTARLLGPSIEFLKVG